MYRYLERLQKSRLSRFTFRSIAFSILLLSLSLLALRGFSALLEDNPVWVNKLLEKYNATTNSLSLSWRYIDPEVEMEMFVFGAGSIQKFKLDFIFSFLNYIHSSVATKVVSLSCTWQTYLFGTWSSHILFKVYNFGSSISSCNLTLIISNSKLSFATSFTMALVEAFA